MRERLATSALVSIVFLVGMAAGLFLLPFWVRPFLAAVEKGNPSDWIGFAGNFGAGIMTLIAATIAWFAVRRQIDATREIAAAKENAIWVLLREDLLKEVARVNFVWRHVDRALLETSKFGLREWRADCAKDSLNRLSSEQEILRLKEFSEGLDAIRLRRVSRVFMCLVDLALTAKRWRRSFSIADDEPFERESDPDRNSAKFSEHDLPMLRYKLTIFEHYLRQLDPALAHMLAGRQRIDFRWHDIIFHLEKEFRISETVEEDLFRSWE